MAVITSIGEGVKLDLGEWDSPEKKSLIYRATGDVVLPTGAVVLKAGEPLGPIVAKHCPGSVVLFSADENEPAFAEHIAAGGKGVLARGGQIVLSDGSNEAQLEVNNAKHAIENMLPAIAAAWALGLTREQIAAGLAIPK